MSRKETTYIDEEYLNYLEAHKEEYFQMFEKESSSQNQVPVNVLSTDNFETTKINIHHTVDMGVKMAYAISDLSLFSQKLFYATVSEIRSDDKKLHPSVFTVKDIIETFKMDKSNAWKALHKSSVEILNAKIFLWNENTKALSVDTLGKLTFTDDKKSVEISLHEDVKKYFLNLKNHFYKVPLEYLLDFSSPKNMRLFYILFGRFYYYLNSYAPKANRRKSNQTEEPETVKFKIPYEQLRTMFEAEKYETYLNTRKIGKDRYPSYTIFYKEFLKDAIKDINNVIVKV